MSVKEKIMGILGITEAEYNKELARHEYERAKAMGCISEFIDQRGKYMAMDWKDALAQQQNAMQQAQLQNQYAMAQQQAMMNNAWTQAGISVGGHASQQHARVKKTFNTLHGSITVPTFEELDDPDSAFNLPLGVLATMWGARFGYRWVKDEDTTAALEENENMWLTVLKRLSDAGRIEVQQFRHPAQLGYDIAWKLKEDHGNS